MTHMLPVSGKLLFEVGGLDVFAGANTTVIC